MTDETEKPVEIREPRASLVTGGQVAPIIPRNIEEVARVAQAVIVAGLAPESYRSSGAQETASRVMIGIMKGAEIGLPPLSALASIAIINGRPCLWGDGAVALIHASGKVQDWRESFTGTELTDDWTAVCEITRKGNATPFRATFSLGEAKRAKLISKLPWVAYPARMLMWRARTYAMRNGFADCLAGLSIAEEIQDLPQASKPVDTAFLDDKSSSEGGTDAVAT